MKKLKDKKDIIINLYNSGKSIRDVAETLSCSVSGIKRILHQYNVYMRNKCESLALCPLSFTDKEYELILGSMLGDSHMTRKCGDGGECHLYIGHSIKQNEYIQYKYDILKRFIGCKIYSLHHTLNNGKIYETLNFVTRKSNLFTQLRNKFYNEHHKIIPFDILHNYFSAYSLSIWYMDDGYNYVNKGCEICSQSFSLEENQKLIGFLFKKFNIKGSIRNVFGGSGSIIYIKKNEKINFIDVVRPYIITSMQYKTVL
jgi:hypothetical protein